MFVYICSEKKVDSTKPSMNLNENFKLPETFVEKNSSESDIISFVSYVIQKNINVNENSKTIDPSAILKKEFEKEEIKISQENNVKLTISINLHDHFIQVNGNNLISFILKKIYNVLVFKEEEMQKMETFLKNHHANPTEEGEKDPLVTEINYFMSEVLCIFRTLITVIHFQKKDKKYLFSKNGNNLQGFSDVFMKNFRGIFKVTDTQMANIEKLLLNFVDFLDSEAKEGFDIFKTPLKKFENNDITFAYLNFILPKTHNVDNWTVIKAFYNEFKKNINFQDVKKEDFNNLHAVLPATVGLMIAGSQIYTKKEEPVISDFAETDLTQKARNSQEYKNIDFAKNPEAKSSNIDLKTNANLNDSSVSNVSTEASEKNSFEGEGQIDDFESLLKMSNFQDGIEKVE